MSYVDSIEIINLESVIKSLSQQFDIWLLTIFMKFIMVWGDFYSQKNVKFSEISMPQQKRFIPNIWKMK